jgi:glutathione-regulated potassium-efflux system ancillary protein KefC
VKFRLRTLARPEIWVGTSLHTVFVVLLLAPVIFLVSGAVGAATGMNGQSALLLGFALSFSSTVFAVKSLEQSGDMGAMHGRVAIGMLITQDILAVGFLTFSTGKIPSLWAIGLVAALVVGRKPLGVLIGRSGTEK